MVQYPTIVIHGFLTNTLTNLPIHVALRRKGFETHDVPIPGLNTTPIARASEIVATKVQKVLQQSNSPKVNLIGVSKGGVIALNYLRHHNGHHHTNKAITLGSPLNGTHAIKRLATLPIVGKNAAELLPDSSFMKAFHAPRIATTQQAEVISIYAEGDVVVNKEAATVPEARVIKAPAGSWPLGHYQLVTNPKNLKLVVDELLHRKSESESYASALKLTT